MTTELDKVKRQIRALSMRTTANGCTEAEAVEAMEKVGEYLTLYNLTMDEVELSQEKCIQATINLHRRTLPRWAYIFASIGTFTQTKAWMSKPLVNFFGFEPDVTLAVYLAKVLMQAMDTETRRFKHSSAYQLSLRRRHLTHSFQLGLVRRLSDRLEESRPRGQSLILVKTSAIEKELRRQNPKLRFRPVNHGKSWVNSNAYGAGQDAGDRVNLNRPVGAGAGSQIAGYLT